MSIWNDYGMFVAFKDRFLLADPVEPPPGDDCTVHFLSRKVQEKTSDYTNADLRQDDDGLWFFTGETYPHHVENYPKDHFEWKDLVPIIKKMIVEHIQSLILDSHKSESSDDDSSDDDSSDDDS
jgi:hypothetical protein